MNNFVSEYPNFAFNSKYYQINLINPYKIIVNKKQVIQSFRTTAIAKDDENGK